MRPEYSLALWHGFNAPLLMSCIALAAGIAVYFGLQRYINLHSVTRLPVSGKHVFDAVVGALETLAHQAGHAAAVDEPARPPRAGSWRRRFAAMAWPLSHFGFGQSPTVISAGAGPYSRDRRTVVASGCRGGVRGDRSTIVAG